MEIEAPPSNPALDAARAEAKEIATNPQNPRHAGYWRGEKQVMGYLDGLYENAEPKHAKVPLATESVSLGPVDPQGDETPDEAAVRQRNEVILAPLKQEWGLDYEQRFAAAKTGLCTMFEGKWEILNELGTHVRMTYGPKGEAAALKFFSELEAIKQQGG